MVFPTMEPIISYGRLHCKELAPHKNQGMEITYVEHGILEWMVEGREECLGPGTIFFTLPWQIHGSLNPREPDNTIWHILFHLDEVYPSPRDAISFPAILGFAPDQTQLLSQAFTQATQHAFPATPAIRWLMPALIHEMQNTHALGHAHTITLLRAVLVELKRIITGEASDDDAHTWSERRVKELLTRLSSACDTPWTLKEMATQCGLQRTRLNTIFQKLTGSSPMEYLARLRIESAKTLLRETDLKIIEIAFECGFGSSQYFANSFRRATEMTPSTYRQHCRQLSPGEREQWRQAAFRSEQEEQARVHTFSTDSPPR
jgi:AraC family L-rhamnose operon regulatory protein RhaS